MRTDDPIRAVLVPRSTVKIRFRAVVRQLVRPSPS
jgi:hypothetical protein